MQIWIGFEPREAAAFAVTVGSIKRHLTAPIPVRGLVLNDLRERGLYTRPTEWRPSQVERPVMWDVISDAPCATEFACSRFLTPIVSRENILRKPYGWALFLDCDMLVRGNLVRLFEYAATQSDKAVLCVKHQHQPSAGVKMDGQTQTTYSRKNWSSFVLFNCDHPANDALTVDLVNSVPGRDLHRFCWLDDDEIGEIGPEWNWLVGESDPVDDPIVCHYTTGGPWFHGYENVPYADEWRAELARFGTLRGW